MKIQVESVQDIHATEESAPEQEKFVELDEYFKKRVKKIKGFLNRGKEALVQDIIHELRV
jgi:hypothetical protein